MQDKMDDLFWDSEGGGYFTSSSADKSIVLRLKEDQVSCLKYCFPGIFKNFFEFPRTALNPPATPWPPPTSSASPPYWRS